tara:strand:+ start:1715 stop:2083 length:369 start_codon:yes stop_codon:yes gene_type:complete
MFFKMAKVFIYSTMSSDNDYIVYENGAAKHKVTIAGKANVADKLTLLVKEGAVTMIDQEQYELIKENYHFKKHLEGGFLTVENKNVEASKVSKGMSKKDKSAQKTEEDFKHIKDLNPTFKVE